MICLRHKPSEKPANLGNKNSLEPLPWGSRPYHCLQLVAVSLQPRHVLQRPSCSHDTLLELSPKEVAVDQPKMANRRDFLGQAQSPSPLSSLLVLNCTAVVTNHLKQTSPHCLARKIAEAISKSLRPSHRRSFRSAFYLWHTPTLVDFNHLVD